MAKSSKKRSALNLYSNLVKKRQAKKDRESRRRAEYLASLPKHPVKRFFYKLHPKRVAAFWFSKRGLILGLKMFGVAVLLVVLLVGGVFAYYRKDLDSVRPGKLAERVRTTVTKYYDRNNVLLWEDKGDGDYRLAVKSEEISDYMKKATIAIEDKDFYKHDGISVVGITRSFFNNAKGGDVQGGSTLTQQLVKQVFLADEAHKRGIDGIPRKIKEVILAIEVERMYTKDQLLNLYLNESSYGGRRNGVESASQTYFKKSAKQLTLAESALLAAIPNQPGWYDPYNTAGNKDLIKRQQLVLDAMVTEKYITRAEADAAKKVAVLDSIQPLADQLKDIKAPHFVLMVKQQLEKELGKSIAGRGGLTVKTTLDIRIQQKLEESMDKMFSSGQPEAFGFTNGAATVEDTQTGQIVALMGSRNFTYPGFGQDNAATAFIQPGSTIKPLVFAQLFENKGSDKMNFGSGSVLADDKSMDQIYGAPLRNADGGYKGGINVRQSLGLSRNVPAVKAMYVSGIQETWNTIRKLGDKQYCTQGPEVQAGLSSSIGGCGTRQIDHVNAFASLGRMGVYMPTSTILEVKNAQNEVLKKYKTEKEQAIDAQSAYIVSDILSDDNARAGLYGRNKYGLVVPGVRTAAKTGTSDKGGQAKDIWTMSYSPALAMGVWLGNSDTRTLRGGNSSVPAQIVGDVMQFAHLEVYAKENKWKSGDWFTQPSGIKKIGNEIYPSWYDKKQAESKEKVVFDRVSKKKATNCTPADARVEVEVMYVTDPIAKKKVLLPTDGYDPTKDDDAHSCDDAKPSLGLSISSDGKKINVSYVTGKFPLKNVMVSVNGTQIANLSVSGSNSSTIDNTIGLSSASLSIEASVIDEGYYKDSATRTWTNPQP